MSNKLLLDKNIVIDDIEEVLYGIQELSGKKISDPETIKRFVNEEKATKFYISNKGQAKMQPDKDSLYIWVDSGFTNAFGQCIFISLLKQYGEYTGHYIGTIDQLSGNIRSYFPKHSKEINRNIAHFKDKYKIKTSERKNAHIEDEQEYLLKLCNEDTEDAVFAELIRALDVQFADDTDECEQLLDEGEQNEPTEEVNYSFSVRERNITIDLLLETIDEMQNYINELTEIVKKCNEDKEKAKELEEKNAELIKALAQVRNFTEAQEAGDAGDHKPENGHDLLGRKGKILVLGATTLDVKTLCGISKQYGFTKDDFEYHTDYAKMVSFIGRSGNLSKYSAVILGAMPHKVASLGDWSSFIEKCKNDDTLPFAVDARNHAGELKVTKESYRRALLKVCQEIAG